MVESKFSIYDDSYTPLVPAEPVDHANNGLVDVRDVSDAASDPTFVTSGAFANSHRPDESRNTGDGSNPDGKHDNSTTENDEKSRKIVASGVASATVGLLLMGPIGAALCGFGAAYAAKTKPVGNGVGDSARAIGEVALVAVEKMRAIDEKHHVVDETKKVVKDSYEKIKKVDQEYHILDRTSNAIVRTWDATVHFVQKHRLIERGIQGVGSGVCWVVETIASKMSRSTSTPNEFNESCSNTEDVRSSLHKTETGCNPTTIPRDFFGGEQAVEYTPHSLCSLRVLPPPPTEVIRPTAPFESEK